MNNLVDSEYDSFEKKKDVTLKEFISPTIIDNTLGLQNVRIIFSAIQKGEKEPSILLFVGNQEKEIRNAVILIKCGDSDIYSYDAIARQDQCNTACAFEVDVLRKMCEADKVEIRIKNSDGHTDFTSEEIRFGARAIYNAIVDENAYVEEIQRREKEKEEKQNELERVKKAEIEKFNQKIARITNDGVNKFFSVDYDQFKQKLTVNIKEEIELERIDGKGTMIIANPKIGFRYVYVNEKIPSFLVDFEAVSKTGLNLKNGELLFLLDQTKRLSLQPHENYSEPHLQEFHIESDWYEITEDELKSLCESRVIEMRITNGDEYHDLTTEGLQVAARRFYNAVVDNTAYTDDLYTQAEREAIKQERIRKEREEKEAEEARIRAEKRAEWWAANKMKVGIAILILIGIIAAIIGIKKIVNVIAAKQAVSQAYEMIEQGEALIPSYKFDEAKQLYDKASRITDNDDVHKKVQEKRKELEEASQAAESEYNDALRRLQILLDADDNEFNDLSNACLDKMIEIYPDRRESVYYKNLRDGISDVDATTSATQVQHATQYLRLDMKGSIGTSQGFLEYDEQEDKGNYSYYLSDATVKRKVSLESHDGDRLKLNSYDMSGKYIGQFDGTTVVKGNQISYVGTFTNYKGVSVKFKLYQK